MDVKNDQIKVRCSGKMGLKPILWRNEGLLAFSMTEFMFIFSYLFFLVEGGGAVLVKPKLLCSEYRTVSGILILYFEAIRRCGDVKILWRGDAGEFFLEGAEKIIIEEILDNNLSALAPGYQITFTYSVTRLVTNL